MTNRRGLSLLLSFAVGIAVAILIPRFTRAGLSRILPPEHRREISRVTSPDRSVDAVMQILDCGAPCSSEYSVSVVRRGDSASSEPLRQIFLADDVSGGEIRWKEAHLLEIAYDRAFIQSFRNVAYPFGRAGSADSWRYAVEIRLSPSSARFSYLAGENMLKTSP